MNKRTSFTIEQLEAWLKEAYEEGFFEGGRQEPNRGYFRNGADECWKHSEIAKTLAELAAAEEKILPIDEIAVRIAPELWKNGSYENFSDASHDAYRFAAEMFKARETTTLPEDE